MAPYLPPGWPSAVQAPESSDFEATAAAWLLDVLPPGYREQQRAARYAVGLATIARHHTEACVAGARQGYRSIRAELEGHVPTHEIGAVLEAYQEEGRKLVATARAVFLVEQALRGVRFTPKL